MKTYILFATVIVLSLSLKAQDQSAQNQADSSHDFISTRLFFEEALLSYNDQIDTRSLTISEVSESTDDLHMSNFKTKSDYINTLNEPYNTYKVQFLIKGSNNLVSCLGSVLGADHSIMELEVAKDFKERTKRIYLSECKVSNGSITDNFKPNFAIDKYVSFPKSQNLPISYGSTLDRYRLFKSVDTNKKLLQCVQRDTNSFGSPRTAISVYNMPDHYSVDVFIGLTSTANGEPDIAVNIGDVDKNTMPWLVDNIDFFQSLGDKGMGSNGSSFNLIFKKSDCQRVGDEKGINILACQLKIPETNQFRNIKRVSFTFETQIVTKTVLKVNTNPDLAPETELKNVAQYKSEIKFTLDEQNKYESVFPETHYRTNLNYSNDVDLGSECMFASQMPQQTQQNRLTKQDVAI